MARAALVVVRPQGDVRRAHEVLRNSETEGTALIESEEYAERSEKSQTNCPKILWGVIAGERVSQSPERSEGNRGNLIASAGMHLGRQEQRAQDTAVRS